MPTDALKSKSGFVLLFSCFLCFLVPSVKAETGESRSLLDGLARSLVPVYARIEEPDYLTYDELRSLSQNPRPGGSLAMKLEKLWRTPVISNEAYYQGAKPIQPRNPLLGPVLRVASWNIEKSIHMDRAINLLVSDAAFRIMVNAGKVPEGSEAYRTILRQRERLMQADILILQEVEIGVKRSGYRDNARELAQALDMNYAYGVQYLEIDPVILGLENLQYEDGKEDEEAEEFYRVDPAKYKGVFGSAVLSRYPIKDVILKPLVTQPYDWYEGEKEKIGFLEKSRRFGAKTVFQNELTREMKVGGRHMFRVDLDVPGIEGGVLSVINIHLEIKCQPKGREEQMEEILSYIRKIKHPVIVMGDFNAAPADISPTSAWRVAKRTAKNPTTWFGLAVSALSPHGLAVNTTRTVSNVTKNFQDPTTTHVPVVAPNPVKGLFDMIEGFRFADGKAFDFRGSERRSVGGKSGTLANSNQRDLKGFKTTFQVKRPLGPIIGKYRLDWAFVKSHLLEPRNDKGPYQLAPHFGETLEELNTSLKVPISDHHPNVIDLPFEEPNLPRG